MISSGPKAFVYLASVSPRRRQLLGQLGLAYEPVAVNVDETPVEGETGDDYVCRLALAKARAAAPRDFLRGVVLAADTAVVLDGEILGKPVDEADGRRMLTRLAGRTHEVFTAAAALDGEREEVAISRTSVRFRAISASEFAAYWASGEPRDKAGAYGIQGLGAIFVAEIHGSYSGVMGLPLFETARMLESFGYRFLGNDE